MFLPLHHATAMKPSITKNISIMETIVKIFRKGCKANARNYAAGLLNTIDRNSLRRYEKQNFNYIELNAYLSAKH